MTGPVRVLAATYSILALAAGARSLTQITTHLSEAPLAYGLSAVAAAAYLLIAVACDSPRATGDRCYGSPAQPSSPACLAWAAPPSCPSSAARWGL